MATLLLVIIFIDFIGLGIPDSLFGPAWPAIYSELSLPVSLGSCVSIITTAGTITASLLSARLIKRFGTAKITAISTVLTAIALFGFSVSKNFVFLCLFAVPLGLGGGAIDSGLNNYVALHYKATHMNFLHCFYGVGVTVSPYLMSIALSNANDWRSGYRYAFCIQVVIAAITVFSIPLWKKVSHGDSEGAEEAQVTIPLIKQAKNRRIRMAWLMFICSCAIECTCGSWGSTFLVESRGLSEEVAAKVIMFYYMGIAVGRFLSGVLAYKFSSWKIIKMGFAVIAVAICMLFVPYNVAICTIALFLIGLGNGPVFPNLVHLTPEHFGKDVSQAIVGSQMAMAYVGIMLFPMIYGQIAQNITPDILPIYIMILFVLMILASVIFNRGTKKNGHLEIK